LVPFLSTKNIEKVSWRSTKCIRIFHKNSFPLRTSCWFNLSFLEIDKQAWSVDIDFHIENNKGDLVVLADISPTARQILISQIQFWTLISRIPVQIRNFRDLRITVRNRSFDFVYPNFGIGPDHILSMRYVES
jgi:hypothetical protein